MFVGTARRSPHAPQSAEEELNMLIYNWQPYFTLKDSVMDPSYDGPDMTYFFDNPMDEPDELGDAAGRRRAAAKDFRGQVASGGARQRAGGSVTVS